MDLNGIVRLIYDNHELIVGISITLLLVLSVLMLVRSVLEERNAEKTAGKSGDFDSKTLNSAIEGAMKKVLADKGIQGAIAGAAAAGGTSGSGVSAMDSAVDATEAARMTAELKRALHEKESKIAALMTDVEALKAATENARPTADGGVAAGGVDIDGLHAKLAELQAKLAEYEIIEDDIADLSIYKEENKKLKAELATLKAAIETAQTQVHAASASVEAVPRTQDPVQVAQAAVTASKQEKFELNTDDSVMKEFADAISGKPPKASKEEIELESALIVASDAALADPKAAIDAILGAPQSDASAQALTETLNEESDESASEIPPAPNSDEQGILDEALDTSKLQEEVSRLAAELESMPIESDGEKSVLDESLDTDKLMREMALEPERAKISEKPQAVSHSASSPVSAKVEDDLLAEFKDVDFQNTKNQKGS